jgi:hypothetical protein
MNMGSPSSKLRMRSESTMAGSNSQYSDHRGYTAAEILLYPIYVAKITGGTWDYMWNPKLADALTSDRAYNIEKARNELGYFSTYTLENDVKETVESYRENEIIQ